MSNHWSPEELPWEAFDPERVEPNLVPLIKAASMVESNGRDYAAYLNRVFADDPQVCEMMDGWAHEEVQHGVVLGRWAKLADPGFDYDAALARFRAGYAIKVDVDASVRGSRTGEMIARCMVEVGTSSLYSALADRTDEPLLKAVCRRIAADELRHYALFYRTMKRYLVNERLNRFERIRIAFGRVLETEDDELAYAWFAANDDNSRAYDHRKAIRAWMREHYALYRPHHARRSMTMIFKAVGLKPNGWLSRLSSGLAITLIVVRARWLARGGPR